MQGISVKLTPVFKIVGAAFVVAAAGSASAQLSDQGSFGQATYSSASSGYSPGRIMKWIPTGDVFKVTPNLAMVKPHGSFEPVPDGQLSLSSPSPEDLGRAILYAFAAATPA